MQQGGRTRSAPAPHPAPTVLHVELYEAGALRMIGTARHTPQSSPR